MELNSCFGGGGGGDKLEEQLPEPTPVALTVSMKKHDEKPLLLDRRGAVKSV